MIIKIIKPVLSGGSRSVEVRRDVEIQHANSVQRTLSTRVWGDNCSSYYVDRSTGWNGAISPYGAASLWSQIAFLDKSAWIYKVRHSWEKYPTYCEFYGELFIILRL
jgi:hypothetical protein